MSTRNHTAQALLILSIGTAIIIGGGNTLQKWLLAQPHLQITQHYTTEQSKNTKVGAIHIIREANTTTSASLQQQQTATIPASLADQLFGTPAQQHTNTPDAPAPPPITDYFQQLTTSNHLRLDAITSNGAIISGKFIEQGQPITQFAYPAPGTDLNTPEKTIAPKLTKITNDSITITEPIAPHRNHTLKLN